MVQGRESRFLVRLMSSPINRSIMELIDESASLRSKTWNVNTWRRLKARSCLVKAAARWPAVRISVSERRSGSSARTWSNTSVAHPLMTVSRLLKSWATPPAKRPIPSILWACRS
jgi:hypothetical protein